MQPRPARKLRIHTIGHSTRSADELVDLLQAHGVAQLADVRTLPKSRRHPHFNREALENFLPSHRVAYRHFPGLGGLRHPRRDSPNGAWRVEGFRGYADYMLTGDFERSLEELVKFAKHASTAVMCAEALWWQCHRRLLADALVVRGIDVLHISSARSAEPHELTEFGRVRDGQLVYPDLFDGSETKRARGRSKKVEKS